MKTMKKFPAILFLLTGGMLLQGCALWKSETYFSKNEQKQIDRQRRILEQQRREDQARKEAERLRQLQRSIEANKRKEAELFYRHDQAVMEKERVLNKSVQRFKLDIDRETRQLTSELRTGIEKFYQDAVRLFKERAYGSAIGILNNIEELWPDYKNTRGLLEQAHKETAIEAESEALTKKISQKVETRDQTVESALDLFEKDILYVPSDSAER